MVMLTWLVLSLILQQTPVREVVLEGTITAVDRYKWLEREFEVPAGTARIDVETSFTEAAQGTALEYGIYDPVRFRGASRFSKTSFFLSRTAATPSYYPGDLPPRQMAAADRRAKHSRRSDVALSDGGASHG